MTCPKPQWHPDIIPSKAWTVAQLQKCLRGQPYTLFKHGTCVVWPPGVSLTKEQSRQALQAVVQGSPDFKVRKHAEGDLLVTFRGGVGAIVSGKLLQDNFPILKAEAMSKGFLPGEALRLQEDGQADDMDIIAGLYARARLYRDAGDPVIVDTA
ncbi:hypothetical protein [Bordetella petrii]|uniref:hypothetical protein n=1 Tax=Bordetella petrii TaxID=94624 RepID=UPI001E4C0BCA|nr:hypothetical protein [Bordetella petrii]MCD0505060.1 hypothetical protein [Bordetella petrii]